MTNSGIENIGIFTKNKSRSLVDHLTNGRPWDLNRKKDGLRIFNFGDFNPQYDDVHNFLDNIDFFSYVFALFEVSAVFIRVGVKKIDLTADLLPDWSELRRRVDDRTKLIFLCTPNNPTGKVIPYGQIERLSGEFQGMVIVDEAYIDFTDAPSAVHLLD